jgi:hypothetical protein
MGKFLVKNLSHILRLNYSPKTLLCDSASICGAEGEHYELQTNQEGLMGKNIPDDVRFDPERQPGLCRLKQII